MALIRCGECQKEISDTAKICPHCGYNLKKDRKKINFKIDIYNIRTISCVLLILSFITSFFAVSFSRDNYSSSRQLLSRSFNDMMYYLLDNFDKVFIIIGIISILALVYYILGRKVKFKKIIYYIPTFIYSFFATILIFVVLLGGLDIHTPKYDTYYRVCWGGIWILVLLYTSTVLLIIDLIVNRRKNEKGEK